jgi:hypothetical protein
LTDGPTLAGLAISDPPERWRALGFAVDDAGEFEVGGARIVRVTLGIAPPGRGIVGWTLHGPPGEPAIDGLATRVVAPPQAGRVTGGRHPNAVAEIDHVVIVTPDFDRLGAALEARGLGLRRIAERDGRRQGFRRLGGPIMEIVEAPGAQATAFWGVTFTVTPRSSFDGLVDANRFVSEPRPAVQPGRRIATVSREAGLSTRVAFMDPEPAWG